jgi:hypothetical protein
VVLKNQNFLEHLENLEVLLNLEHLEDQLFPVDLEHLEVLLFLQHH